MHSISTCIQKELTYRLIVTDAATRGVDLPETACVVNYDAPTQGRTYAHRAGRTARAGRDGTCLTLLRRNQVRVNCFFELLYCTASLIMYFFLILFIFK